MKVLFIHDSKAIQDEKGNIYTGGSYNSSVWDRYLKMSENLTVMLRMEETIYKEVDAKLRFNFFEKSRFKFVQLDDVYKSFLSFISYKKRKSLNSKIEHEVKNNDFLIARLPSFTGNLAIKFAKKHNKPFMIEMVGCGRDALWNYNLKGKLLAPYVYFKTKYYVKSAKYVIYVTNKFLQNRYPNNNINIGLSDVVIDKLNEKSLENRIKKIESIKDELVLGTIGALSSKYKGFETVLYSIYELNKEGFNFKYRILGGGENKDIFNLVKKLNLEDKVFFDGTLPKEKVFDWLDNIDIYVQPSKTEGLPRALIEAMSRACPCLGSNVGGIPEVIESDFVFNKNRYKDLKEVLKETTKDKMIGMAKKNFYESRKYEISVLEAKRNRFYKNIKLNFDK